MKRILLLVLSLALLLTACSGGSLAVPESTGTSVTTEETQDAGIHDPTGFSAGYAKKAMTPLEPVPLAGYGNTELRMSNRVLDDLYITCIAVSDGENTLLFLTVDIIRMGSAMQDTIASLAEKRLGIPKENVFCCATHTHSGPDGTSSEGGIGSWLRLFYPAAEEAMTGAVADLDRAELLVGSVETENLNFVRRYLNADGSTSGDNYGTPEGRIAHESEADREMQILCFRRANQKDILMVNWQAHPTITGGSTKYNLSADYVGAFRKEAEANLNCHFAYFQGAAGNMNPRGTLEGESTFDVKTHGKKLCEALTAGLEDLTLVASGPVKAVQTTVTCTSLRTMPEGQDTSHYGEILAAFQSGDTAKARQLCLQYGVNSPYAINAYASRSSRPPTMDVAIGAACFGELGFVFASYEMFDTTGMYIKEHSPFAKTLVCEMSLDSNGYLPTELAWDNGGYEVDVTRFVRGTAELLGDEFVKLLNELK